jgi:hypothetical protein
MSLTWTSVQKFFPIKKASPEIFMLHLARKKISEEALII